MGAGSDEAAERATRGAPRGPWELLGALARETVQLTPTLAHVEVYTMRGLLTMLWHGDPTAERVVLCMGGGMGGVIGPGRGLYHHLGEALGEEGIGVLRVGYRRPNDLETCVHDVLAAADVACRQGAERIVTVGHSFGGAVAVQAGIAMGEWAAGVVTLATQSAGCEGAAELGDTPLLLVHGDRDEILPVLASEAVRHLAGDRGELVVVPGAGHLLTEAANEVRELVVDWIRARLTR